MTFYEWATRRPTECNPRGDFQVRLRNDLSAADLPNTREAWEEHLMGQRVAFRSLWGTYERWLEEQTPAQPTEQPASQQMELIEL